MDEPYGPEFTEALNELHGLLQSDTTMRSTLQRVAELACATIRGCDASGVTIIENSDVSTAAATDELTLQIDHDQYDNGEGPCLHASTEQEIVVMPDVASDRRWPSFARAAEGHGLGSVLSIPLAVRDQPLGALNLYSRSPRAFDDNSESLGRLFGAQAAIAISNVQFYAAAARLTRQLEEAIKNREVIGEAKGILMAREGVDEDQAFEMLVRVSQNSNMKLREVAQRIVDKVVKESRRPRA